MINMSDFPDKTLGYDVSLSGNAVRSHPLEMHLNIGTINTVVTLSRPDGFQAGICLAPIGGVSGGCTTGLTQDLTTGITTYNITSVSRTTDQGVWTSTHGSDTGSINITVLTIPTVNVSESVSSMTLSSGTINTQRLNIRVTCAYSAVSLGLSFVPTGGGTAIDAPSSTSTCTSTGNTGCTDTDANSYTCDITPQHEATLSPGTTYYIQVAINLDGQYQSLGLNSIITDTDIIVPDYTTLP
ncbi:uncharacterized protein LOC117340956 isoform X1 [Pecten maximus]|uniref:uncharacterized protein LOC117340956 isoform X1 n=2 Tax=Pecten maximus TaxID=6579 RepID=UPI001457FC09|nr:uncharacterized protein LOC117340956 isoform X1 [Pecten maximus]